MIHTREVEYRADGSTATGHLARPDAPGPHPAVLIGHEGIGLNDFQRERADRLAEHGYVALAMDYHHGRWFADPAEMMAVVGPLIADPNRMRAIGGAALQVLLDQLDVDPSRVAAIGYGAGGTIALELGRGGADLRGIATVNPVLPTDSAEQWALVGCPILVSVGSEDPLVGPEQLRTFARQMRAVAADWQLIVHGGAEHAFHLPPLNADGSLSGGDQHTDPTPGVSYHREHARRSWQAILAFLRDCFDPDRLGPAAASPVNPEARRDR